MGGTSVCRVITYTYQVRSSIADIQRRRSESQEEEERSSSQLAMLATRTRDLQAGTHNYREGFCWAQISVGRSWGILPESWPSPMAGSSL